MLQEAPKAIWDITAGTEGGHRWDAQEGDGMTVGGGIFALRRPRPYSRHLRGWRCDPNAGHCRLHAHFLHPTCPHEPVVLKRRGALRRYLAFTPFPVGLMRIPCRRACLSPMGIYGLYHDAAHRVATLFEKWDYVIKTSLPEEGFPIND